jgi:hypothetical protein
MVVLVWMGSLMSKSDNCSTDAGEIGEPISFW